MTDDSLITYGSAIKAVGSRGFSGHAIIFGGADQEGDSFFPDCDLGLEGRVSLPAYWCHALDPEIGNRKFSDVDFKVTSEGLFVRGEFKRLDRVEEELLTAINKGRLGFSSASTPHLVRKRKRGAVNEITTWPLSEISLTPNPVEKRTKVLPLKSIKAWSLEDLLAVRDYEAEALRLRVKLAASL
jgi:phage head maturation protease